MQIITIQDIHRHVGKGVQLQGWVFNVRSSGKIAFLQLRDGTGTLQMIGDKAGVSDELWQKIAQITVESAVAVHGKVSKHPKKDEYELQLSDLTLVHKAQEYPIGKKDHGPDFLLDKRHLWIRSPKQAAILRIRSEVLYAFHEFYQQEGFYLTHTPTFTPNSCEGTSDLFEVEYFDRKVYLSQNGQLYLEALAAALGKVYDMNPNFRAEKSKTRRHLTEFWTINPEISFAGLQEGLHYQEKTYQFLAEKILERCARDLELLERDTTTLENTTKGNFPRLTHAEAVAKLQKMGSKIGKQDDLGAEDETILTKEYDRPIFITNYPREVKPFYMPSDPGDPNVVINADMLAPEGYGEIVGGGARLTDYETLHRRLQDAGLSLDDFGWYLDLRRYGSVPHYGYGIGIERTVRWITGVHHIRETVPFPRMLNRIKP